MPGIVRKTTYAIWALIVAATLGVSDLACAQAASADKVVPAHILRIPEKAEGTEPVYTYITTLLAQALDANADKYGTVRLHPNPHPSVQSRQLRNLANGLLDVTWSITSTDRENDYRPIRIPLLNGLFGKRVLLIQADDQRFDAPLGAEQLKPMLALQGYDWPDARILRHNNFTVIEAPYQTAFRMLSEGYADYFPRSPLEVGFEIEKWKNSNLVIEPHLLLNYRSAMFFFVSKNNEALANRIEDGLKRLQHAGTFATLLQSQPFYKQGVKLMQDRHEIKLENPLLSTQSLDAMQVQLPLQH